MDYNDIEVTRVLSELKYIDDDKEFMTVVLDFDGTVVEHAYPMVGKELPHCIETLKRWQEKYGVTYILCTMRPTPLLKDAVEWFQNHDIKLFGIQKHPTQEEWTDSTKTHGRWMIDDRNVGQPLALDSRGIPCVDWLKTAEIFESILERAHEGMMKYIKNKE